MNPRLCDGNFGSQEVWSFFNKETKVLVIKVLRQWSSARHSVDDVKQKRLHAMMCKSVGLAMNFGGKQDMPQDFASKKVICIVVLHSYGFFLLFWLKQIILLLQYFFSLLSIMKYDCYVLWRGLI